MVPVRSPEVLATKAISLGRGEKPGSKAVYVVPPNTVPTVVTISIELTVFVTASYTKDPDAVPPSSNVTPAKFQVIPSAEAMDGTLRRIISTITVIVPRSVSVFILLSKRQKGPSAAVKGAASQLPFNCNEYKELTHDFWHFKG